MHETKCKSQANKAGFLTQKMCSSSPDSVYPIYQTNALNMVWHILPKHTMPHSSWWGANSIQPNIMAYIMKLPIQQTLRTDYSPVQFSSSTPGPTCDITILWVKPGTVTNINLRMFSGELRWTGLCLKRKITIIVPGVICIIIPLLSGKICSLETNVKKDGNIKHQEKGI